MTGPQRVPDPRESVNVLEECIELQRKKSLDYQNPNSHVKQAMHYRRGVDTIFDIMTSKMLRIQSLLESGQTPKNEPLEDSFKDLINYASFAVSYMRGKMEGQDPENDIFNQPKINKLRKLFEKNKEYVWEKKQATPSKESQEGVRTMEYRPERDGEVTTQHLPSIHSSAPYDWDAAPPEAWPGVRGREVSQPYVNEHDVEQYGLNPADGATRILSEPTR